MNITELAYESGFDTINDKVHVFAGQNCITGELYTFAKLVRNAALEEAAHDCELLLPSGGLYHSEQTIWDIATLDCADAIRSLKDSA